MLIAMPTTTLAERLLRVREEAGYGGQGQAATFARLIGVAPASLHDLESGKTRAVGKSLPGYIKIGANPTFILHGKGLPMLFRDIEKNLHAQTLISMVLELKDDQRQIVEEVVKGFLRHNPGGSPNDPFKLDPPKKDG